MRLRWFHFTSNERTLFHFVAFPLLFNILISPTQHTLQFRIPIIFYYSSRYKVKDTSNYVMGFKAFFLVTTFLLLLLLLFYCFPFFSFSAPLSFFSLFISQYSKLQYRYHIDMLSGHYHLYWLLTIIYIYI